MPVPRKFNVIAGLAIAASAESVAAHIAGNHGFIVIFKPLAAVLLLALPVYSWSRAKQPAALWISIGLFFSLIGDILLLWPDKCFLPGLAAFLLTHIAYLVAFTRDAKLLSRAIAFPYFLVAVAAYALLFPSLPDNLRIPVALYAALLSCMAAQAMVRFFFLKTATAKLAAIGALSFMFSDFLLAFDRFHTVLLLAPVLILAPYYVAQFFIALSTRRAGA